MGGPQVCGRAWSDMEDAWTDLVLTRDRYSSGSDKAKVNGVSISVTL